MPSDEYYNKKLKKFFGFEELRPLQLEIVKTLCNYSDDVLAILPTSAGKTICYILPALIFKQYVTIVISPTLSLMRDQKINLEEKKINIICMNSDMNADDKNYVISNVSDDEGMIIYMTPEYFLSAQTFLKKLYKNDRILYIAIDESHCVSTWGNDFRPSYKKLSIIKEWMPEIRIIAFTATATKKVQDDIKTTLNMKDTIVFKGNLDRKNLFIECVKRTEKFNEDFKYYVDTFKDDYVIVYARTKEKTKEISEQLQNMGVNCNYYNAGLSNKERNRIQSSFESGETKWIVATVAFGMGIDQNIKLVIHYSPPGDLESYYQEIGRAGRDGKKSYCVLMHNTNDMKTVRFLLNSIEDPIHKAYRTKQIKDVENFIRTNKCRRKPLLKYFDETYIEENCGMCDNCCKTDKEKEIQENQNEFLIRETFYPIYCIILSIHDRKVFGGIVKLTKLLRGSNSKDVQQFNKLPYFGICKNYSDEHIKLAFQILIHNQYLYEEPFKNGFGNVIKVTNASKNYYNLILTKSKEHSCNGINLLSFTKIKPYIKKTLEIPSNLGEINIKSICLSTDHDNIFEKLKQMKLKN